MLVTIVQAQVQFPSMSIDLAFYFRLPFFMKGRRSFFLTMKNSHFFLFALGFGCFYCKKDTDIYPSHFQHEIECVEKIPFSCSGQTGNYFFKGNFDGATFCVSADMDGYEIKQEKGYSFSTDDPFFVIGNANNVNNFFRFGIAKKKGIVSDLSEPIYSEAYQRALNLEIRFEDNEINNWSQLLEKHIVLGSLPLATKVDSISIANGASFPVIRKKGFEIVASSICYQKDADGKIINVTQVAWSSARGNQTNSFFKCTSIEKNQRDDGLNEYDLKFLLEFDLYAAYHTPTVFWKRLTKGEFSVKIIETD